MCPIGRNTGVYINNSNRTAGPLFQSNRDETRVFCSNNSRLGCFFEGAGFEGVDYMLQIRSWHFFLESVESDRNRLEPIGLVPYLLKTNFISGQIFKN